MNIEVYGVVNGLTAKLYATYERAVANANGSPIVIATMEERELLMLAKDTVADALTVIDIKELNIKG